MTLPLSTFTNARDTDASVLRSIPRDSVSARLRDWFDVWDERVGEVDHEVLGDAGILVGDAGHADIDRDASMWRDDNPSVRRSEIVADFLAGYWRTAPSANRDIVLSLMRWLDTLPASSWPYAATLLALFVAATTRGLDLPDDTRATVRRRLLTELGALRRSGAHPGIAQYLDYLVDQ